MADKPTHIGPYKILRKLGAGGMADVYEVLDERLQRKVALKLLSLRFMDEDDRVERFQREILATAKLSHPNIVTVFDTGTDGDFSYYTMSLLPGGELKQKISEGMSFDEIFQVSWDILQALAYAHQQNFVHRDLKPENILFDEHGNSVLTDLGIAKLIGTNTTATGISIGTPHYMSPEQARGQEVDARSDLYSFGVVLYRMLTQKPLFQAADSLGICLKHVQEAPPPLPDNCALFQSLLDKLLEKDPAQRFQSAQEVLKELEILHKQWQSKAESVKASATRVRQAVVEASKKFDTTQLSQSPSAVAQTPTTPKKIPIVAASAAVLIAIGLVVVFLLGKNENGAQQTSANRSESSDATSVNIPRLLAIAEHYQQNQLGLLENGRDSLSFYREILSADPEHQKALAHVERLLANGRTQLNQLIEARNFEEASAYSEFLSRRFPEYEDHAATLQIIQNLQSQTNAPSAPLFMHIASLIEARHFYEAELAIAQQQADLNSDELAELQAKYSVGLWRFAREVERYSGKLVLIQLSENGNDHLIQASATEINFLQWDACVADGACQHQPNDEGWGRDNRPVINVSYEDIERDFLPWIKQLTGENFRLPSNNEWLELNAEARSQNRAINSTELQAQHAANALGLYDMQSNVAEWTSSCADINCNAIYVGGSSWRTMRERDEWVALAKNERNSETGFRLVKDYKLLNTQ